MARKIQKVLYAAQSATVLVLWYVMTDHTLFLQEFFVSLANGRAPFSE